MRAIRIVVVVVAALGMGLIALPAASAESPETVVLSGTLLGASGETIGTPLVTLTAGEEAFSERTNGSGRYSFSVAPGTYRLEASGSGLSNGRGTWTLRTEEFSLTESQERNLRRPSALVTLTVEVLGEAGKRVSGATITPPEYAVETLTGGLETKFISASPYESTGPTGRASFAEFENSAPTGAGTATFAKGSPYELAHFEAPALGEEGATVVVHPPLYPSVTGEILNATGRNFALVEEDGTPYSFSREGGSQFSLSAPAGTYRLSISGGPGYNIPTGWGLITEPFSLTGHQERNVRLPSSNSTLTVEVLGEGGEPLPNVTVTPPAYSVTGEAAGLGATYTSDDLGVLTASTGKASFREFDGATPSGEGSIVPPSGSGYATVGFSAPKLENAATVAVRLAGEGAEVDDGPRLEGLSIEPGEIDTSGGPQTVAALADITDGPIGLKSAQISFGSPNGKANASGSEFELVSGTASDGIYRIPVTFEGGSEAGEWAVEEVRIKDLDGLETVRNTSQIAGSGFASAVFIAAAPPVVSSVEAATGPEAGGTEVLIAGENLSRATEVLFGSTPAARFSVGSDQAITAVAPAGTGRVDVRVVTPFGTSGATGGDRFSYEPPVTLSTSQGSAIYGQKVTLTATVSPIAAGAPRPLGSVAFVEGTSTLGVVSVGSKGTAAFSTKALGAGSHPIVARFSGDANFGAGESALLFEEVVKAETRTALTSSLDPAPFGSSATVKASVESVAPGSGVPVGTVTFSEGEVILAAVQLSGGKATLPLKSLPPGAREISATYSGDANHEAGGAEAIGQTIVLAQTEVSLAGSLEPAPYGSSATLKATVKAIGGGGGAASGTVTFREGETLVAMVPLAAGVAGIPLKALAPGTHEISATYSGDEGHEGSAATTTQVITEASTELLLTSSKNPSPFGATGTLKATVKSVAPGGGVPAGTVTFREGEAVLAMIPLSAGTATYPLKGLAIGSHEITATYSGNADYETSGGAIGQVISP